MKSIPVRPAMCATCPFREGSEYSFLKAQLTESALTQRSRICHCTGRNAINGRTGKRGALCRGARDVQLQMFHRMNFISAPTDEAWDAKWAEVQRRKLL